MDPITQQATIAAAGAGGGDPLYVDDVFSTYLYDGTGSAQTITNGIDLAGEGGLVWIKSRTDTGDSISNNHYFQDSERSNFDAYLASNSANAQNAHNRIDVSSNGFSTVVSNLHLSGNTYASWSFRKAPGFFDVVTYTGNGTAGRTISHSLGSVPGMIVIKQTSGTEDWRVYHRSLGATKNLRLNQTYAAGTNTPIFNNTEPTSSVFTVGTDPATNGSGETYVAYIFAHDEPVFGTDEDESIIKCGSYTEGSSRQDIDLGFEPQWIILKTSDSTSGWRIFDVMRGFTTTDGTGNNRKIEANSSSAEGNSTPTFKPTSTGFSAPSGFFGSGTNFIYMAIRRPNKPPEVATDVFAIDTDSASSTIPTWDSGFPVDMAFAFDTLGGVGAQKNSARLLGSKYLVTSTSAAELSDGSLVWDSNEGWGKDYDNNRVYISWMFKRAPGFFDVVAYTGTGSATTVSHNLGVAPELMITKRRAATENWQVYSQSTGASAYLKFTNAAALTGNTNRWNGTAPTSAVFTIGTTFTTADYIAYLFATLPGISKVGSYTGNGSTQNIDCGFTTGARFVLIKRTDSTGDWYVWDTASGIVAGNDPYIALNDANAQVTNTDYIDPLTSGFTVTSSAPAALNASGGSYLFLAIA